MKRNVLFCLLSLSVCLSAQVKEWENPEVFSVNKEPYRTTALPYPDENSALQDVYGISVFCQMLDGDWQFKWAPKPADAPVDFWKEDYDITDWTTMPVPGNWEFNGFGIPFYTNIVYPFPVNPPYVNNEDNPTGAYRHHFLLPESWDGRRVFLHFEGATTAMYIWVNGQKVGFTENAKCPAEFDITPYIRKGENLLACQVYKYGDGSYLEDQDMWRLAGINRSVFVYSTAQTRIQDFFAHPDLDKNYKNGQFGVDVTVKNYTDTEKRQQVSVSLFDKNGKKVFAKSQNITIPAGNTNEITLNGTIANVQKWTAETPNLYTMLLTLKDDKNNIVETTSHRIGFRKVEIKDGQLLVNGKKIYFKGVNLHEFNTNTGQVVDREVMMRNIQLMKELNINAVRTAHYPQPTLWYKLCDEYGIYVLNEANVESHGLGYGPENVGNFPEWREAHMDRMYALVERDKNHASVIYWSLGNESGNGQNFFDMYDWAKERDKSRPIQYERAFNYEDAPNTPRNTDILAPMYPSINSMIADAKRDLGRPYIMCEYAHAMGNSMGNMQEYWDIMRSSKNMQGGFIWEWYNHGYPEFDEQGRFYWAYGGDLKGYNMINDENFCMDGIVSPDQQYLPHTYIVKKVYQNILFEAKDLKNGVITVINDFKFTDLTNKNYAYRWELLKNGELEAEGEFTVAVPADSRKDVKLQLPRMEAAEGTEYYLQVFAYTKEDCEFINAGFEVAREEFALPANNYFVKQTHSGVLDIATTDEKITVTSGETSYEFALNNAWRSLQNFKHDGKDVYKELPRLNFWRAPVDNDFGANDQRNLRLWESAANRIKYTYKGTERADGAIVIKYEAKLMGIEAKVDITYTVNRDGSLTVNAHYQALSDELPEIMRFGMIMTLPEEFDNFTWYGRGPHENYIDRNGDTFMGIWDGKVKDQAHAYYRPQETGNKTDVRWLTLTNSEGKGILVEGCQPLSVSALNVRPEDLDPGTTKKQQHWSDIIPRKETILSVDLFQRGIAGCDSWGARPLDTYRFFGKEYSYSYTVYVLK